MQELQSAWVLWVLHRCDDFAQTPFAPDSRSDAARKYDKLLSVNSMISVSNAVVMAANKKFTTSNYELRSK